MDISLVNSQSLLQLLSLVEKKEQTLQILEQIDAAIISTLKGGTVSIETLEITESPARASLQPAATAKKAEAAVESPSKAAKPARSDKAGRSGGLKDRILALLDTAGPEGLRVKDIAAKLSVKATNVSVWFSTTGKNVTTKIEPGRFAAKGTKPASAPSIKTEEPAKSAAAKIKPVGAAKPAKKGQMSAEGKARIGAAAKARWAARRDAKAVPAVPSIKPVAATKPAMAKKKGGISPEGRAKIAAASKARWAKVRAGKSAKKSTKP